MNEKEKEVIDTMLKEKEKLMEELREKYKKNFENLVERGNKELLKQVNRKNIVHFSLLPTGKMKLEECGICFPHNYQNYEKVQDSEDSARREELREMTEEERKTFFETQKKLDSWVKEIIEKSEMPDL